MPVAIKHPQDPNRPTVISDRMFDPAVHELWVEGVAVSAQEDAPTGLDDVEGDDGDD